MQDFDRILKDLPKRPPRSRLEPYKKLIKGLVDRGRTYREIARILADECGMRVSISTLHDFVRLCLRAERRPASTCTKKNTKSPTTKAPAVMPEMPRMESKEASPSPEDVHRRIAELKQRAPSEKPAALFHYDPDKPLVIPAHKGSTESEE